MRPSNKVGVPFHCQHKMSSRLHYLNSEELLCNTNRVLAVLQKPSCKNKIYCNNCRVIGYVLSKCRSIRVTVKVEKIRIVRGLLSSLLQYGGLYAISYLICSHPYTQSSLNPCLVVNSFCFPHVQAQFISYKKSLVTAREWKLRWKHAIDYPHVYGAFGSQVYQSAQLYDYIVH